MHDELVSVIVPIYNVEKYIKRCIDSIVNQSYKNIQIICVDDGTKDDSIKILSEIADERILIVHKENGGLSSARNYGLEYANGEYVVFIDSDDWVDTEYVSTLISQFTEEDIDISCVAFDYAYEDKREDYEYRMKNEILNGTKALTLLCEGKKITNHVWNKMYRSELLCDVSFKEGRTYEDIFIMHELFAKSRRVSTRNLIMYHYYMREDSILHQKKPQDIINIALAYIMRYNYLENKVQKYFTIKKCAWASYQVLYLYEKKELSDHSDYEIIQGFWKKHREIPLLGWKYFLMYKRPMHYKKIISRK